MGLIPVLSVINQQRYQDTYYPQWCFKQWLVLDVNSRVPAEAEVWVEKYGYANSDQSWVQAYGTTQDGTIKTFYGNYVDNAPGVANGSFAITNQRFIPSWFRWVPNLYTQYYPDSEAHLFGPPTAYAATGFCAYIHGYDCQ